MQIGENRKVSPCIPKEMYNYDYVQCDEFLRAGSDDMQCGKNGEFARDIQDVFYNDSYEKCDEIICAGNEWQCGKNGEVVPDITDEFSNGANGNILNACSAGNVENELLSEDIGKLFD